MGNAKLLTMPVVLIGLFLTLGILGCTSTHIASDVAPISSEETASNGSVPPPVLLPKGGAVREVDPMSGLTFTFSAVDARVRTLIYAMAVDMGLNVVFAKDVDPNIRISGNFLRTPMKDAMDLIMDMGDMSYEIRGNIFYVSRYSAANYNIPYMAITSTPTTSLGGDVVGGADQDGNTNLTGEYSLKFETATTKTDFYTELEGNLKNILAVDKESSVTVNRISSVVSVYTTRQNHKRVKALMDNIVTNAVRQVQIEAKILDVSLSDEWNYGIDWSAVLSNGQVNLVQNLAGGVASAGSMSVVRGSFAGVVNAVAQYGKVDTLANPRITVMNGQSAMITAGEIKPYWNKTLSTTESTGGGVLREYTLEKYSVLDGVMIGVTAFIHDDGSVMLNVLPITTKITTDMEIVDDNNVVQATAPLIDIKESGTVVQVDDGAMLVIGGLITNDKAVTNKRIPILGDIPLLGYLFSNEKVVYTKRELVIFIKPTVIYGKSKVVQK